MISVEYRKKLIEYKEKLKDKNILKIVDGLEMTFDWVDLLIEKKRIAKFNEKEIISHIPIKTIQKLDEIIDLNLIIKEYVKLKEIFLKETKELINFISKSSEVKAEDFDSLQFNLQQVFVKEDITMMMEWARLDLTKARKDEEEHRKEEKRKKKKEKAVYLEDLQKMSQREMNKLITARMFDFSPSARTNQERKDAINNNRRKMENSRKNAQAFALKLMDATEDAGEKAQMNVFKKIGEARHKIDGAREKFRVKAKQIVSPEGPKKELKKARVRVLKARDRINEEKENLVKDLSDAGKMFDTARKVMEGKREELDSATEDKRISIEKQAHAQLNLGKKIVDKAKIHLEDEKRGADILFKEGREYLKEAEKHMEDEKVGTEKLFKIGRGNLEFAKKHLEDEKVGLEKKQEKAKDILHAMEYRLNKERIRGKQWVAREKKRIREIEAGLKNKREKEQERLGLIKKDLVIRGKKTAEKSIEKLKKGVAVSQKSNEFANIPQKQEIQNKFSDIKVKIEKGLEKKKDLIQYDLRFKRDELRIMAETQKEAMTTKLENFQEKQRKLIARYRAQRKANMIRTLLKAMRSMR